jgi:hypothetical protein
MVSRGVAAMKYTVIWESPAENDLATAWLAAVDQLAVTYAAHRLDRALARHPFAIGLPRSSSVNRTAVEPPLGSDYETIADDNTVRVLRVWSLV